MGSSGLPQVIHAVAALTVAAPLTYAGISKLMSPSAFLAALPRLRLDALNRSETATAVGLAELATAAALLLVIRWESAAAAGATYVAFAVIVDRARRLGASGDCGCFGSVQSRIGAPAVVRNGVLALGAAALALGRALGLFPAYDVSSALVLGVLILLASAGLDTFLFVRRALER